ncbi:MAG TPA: hypothetical protein VES95_11650 [Dermatophilaceae bacterium]|nr:hypothetical protein [Dermatophilaceae bacterium]
MLGGAAIALALPVDASPASLALASPAATAAADRSDGLSASRSGARVVNAAAPAVSAPADAAPIVPEKVGVSGVKAVAKPKPKAVVKVAESASSGSSVSSRVSYSTKVSGRCGSIGLNNNAARLCAAVQSAFGLSSIGGYRPNAGEHSTGQAVDFMTSNKATGDAIAAFVQGHVGEFDVEYVIWRQRYWTPGSSWDPMEDRGSGTANHMDHVHVTVAP